MRQAQRTDTVLAQHHAALPRRRSTGAQLRNENVRPRKRELAASGDGVSDFGRGHALGDIELLEAGAEEVRTHVPVDDEPVIVKFLRARQGSGLL
jgi:hypothetical protein